MVGSILEKFLKVLPWILHIGGAISGPYNPVLKFRLLGFYGQI